MSTTERRSLVLLSESDDLGQAMVRMEDGDSFFIAASQAARACSAFNKIEDFGNQFQRLLKLLQEWIDGRRSSIKSAHLNFRERDMLFVVMQASVEFDQKLMDELVQLDLDIANSQDLSLIDLEVLAIPAVSAESAKAFLSSGQVHTYAD